MHLTHSLPLHTPAEPDREALTAAWHGLRDRGFACVAGATTLDEVLGRTTGGALVRMHARCIAHGLQRFRDEAGPVNQRPAVIAPEAPFPTTTAAPTHRAGTTTRRNAPMDRKRAAAGDRDDD